MNKIHTRICATIVAAKGLASTTICEAFDYENLYTKNTQHCSETLDLEKQNILDRFFPKETSERCEQYASETTLDQLDQFFLNKKLTDDEYRQVVQWLAGKANNGRIVSGINPQSQSSAVQAMTNVKSQEKSIEPLPTVTGFKSIGAQSKDK